MPREERNRQRCDAHDHRRTLALGLGLAVSIVLLTGGLAEAATYWDIVNSPNTAKTQNNFLYGVSCSGVDFCMAVGSNDNDFHAPTQTLAEKWDGTSWSIVNSPNTSSTQSNQFSSVSCSSARFCMAVGDDYSDVTPIQTLAEKWDGTSWHIVTSPNTSSPDDYLSSVSCIGASVCMAVGDSLFQGHVMTLTEKWSGSSWHIVSSPNTNAKNNYLSGVSCVSASLCMAAGQSEDSQFNTLIEEWDGTNWHIVRSPNTSGLNYLSSVSCSSTNLCMAVGTASPAISVSQTLTEEWNGIGWNIIPSPNTSSTVNNFLYGISCRTSSFCMAVGGFASHVLTEEWGGTSWKIVGAAHDYVQSNALFAVSCVSVRMCMADGSSMKRHGPDRTLVEEWEGTPT